MSNFGFAKLDTFLTPIPKFDFSLFEFETEFKTANICYHNYLVFNFNFTPMF
jgi:hypothetical protein